MFRQWKPSFKREILEKLKNEIIANSITFSTTRLPKAQAHISPQKFVFLKLFSAIFTYFTKRKHLKIMKNTFYFTRKAPSILKIYNFFVLASFLSCNIRTERWTKSSKKIELCPTKTGSQRT